MFTFQQADLQIINTVAVYLNFVANSEDPQSKTLALDTFQHSQLVSDAQQLLTSLKLKLAINIQA